MRLTRIDIKGFKSFAMDTVLHFNEQVVGVVGPNGSGKSNIVDAIRWVLGEQKAQNSGWIKCRMCYSTEPKSVNQVDWQR